MPRVPFAINSGDDESSAVSAQRLINWYPEIAPRDSKVQVVLKPWPGLKPFATVGAGPIRGQIAMDGVLYVVSGAVLYSVDRSGTATEIGSIGTNATGRASMAHNGLQLVIVNDNDGYVYDRPADTLTKITDADFQEAVSVNYLDGYHIFVKLNSDQFFISASDDPTSYNALDFATAESSPDGLVAVTVTAGQVLLFGDETIEVWYNSGDTFPFDRARGAYIDKGIGAQFSLAHAATTVFWLGNDLRVYRLNGYTPQPISTHVQEQKIRKFSSPGTATGDTYSFNGHDFYILTFPGEGTFVYDITTGLWHERQTFGQDDFRGTAFVRVYDRDFCGDRDGNTLYELSPDVHSDNGDPRVCRAVGVPYYTSGKRAFMGEFEAIFDTGQGLTTGQGSDPKVMLRYSDDDGKTWSPALWRSLGKRGEHRQVKWHRLGSFYERIVELSVSDPIDATLLGANAEIRA